MQYSTQHNLSNQVNYNYCQIVLECCQYFQRMDDVEFDSLDMSYGRFAFIGPGRALFAIRNQITKFYLPWLVVLDTDILPHKVVPLFNGGVKLTDFVKLLLFTSF